MCLLCLDKKALGSGIHGQAVSPVWYRTYHIATWWKGNSLIFAIAYKRILLQCSLEGIIEKCRVQFLFLLIICVKRSPWFKGCRSSCRRQNINWVKKGCNGPLGLLFYGAIFTCFNLVWSFSVGAFIIEILITSKIMDKLRFFLIDILSK